MEGKSKMNFDIISLVIGVLTSVSIFIAQGPYTETWKYLIPITPLFFVILVISLKQLVLSIYNSKSKFNHIKDELDFITSTKTHASLFVRIENQEGDLHVTKNQLIELFKENIIKSTSEVMFSEHKLEQLPSTLKTTNKSTNNAIVTLKNTLLTEETINNTDVIRHEWKYEINPPLTKKGDIVEYTYEYEMPNEIKDAFTNQGDFLILEQGNFTQDISLTVIAPKKYKFVIIRSYIEDYIGKKTDILEKECIPKLSKNNSILEWNTSYKKFSRYVCHYQLCSN
ncbi:hypothetical protein Palpr_2657 [Paludibacter propionicigenes WB4]|uniref:Uncharacterized protein n=1 Tax=Paludibacter propionicigenes (strain DSM 17365 / JCM 13257 / WB4) TaxID=694427 RepID=E4T7U3_PALPW|nr:hypothetical protein [Paludibacter propionicigenes]ADQ80787.1 hypothetical protein Palpr_2657 [Paludibacter propionicigenes WB4]